MSHRRVSPPLIVALAFTLLVIAGWAARPALALQNPKITVTVTDMDGKPLTGVPVTATPVGGNWQPVPGASPTTITTNKKGAAVFVFLKPGDYRVDAKSNALLPRSAATKMRDQQRRPLSDMPDKDGALDPANPFLPLIVPSEANTVDVTLRLGPPVQAQSSGPGKIDITLKELNDAVQAISAKDYEGALAKADAVLAKRADMKPEDVAATLYVRAFSLFQLKRHADAEAAATEALTLNPQLQPAMDVLWKTQVDQKKFAEASETLRKEVAVVQDPGARSTLLLNLGLALREQKKDAEAATALEEARQLTPGEPAVIVQLADLYMATGKTAEAEALLNADLPPEQAAVLQFNMAANLYRQKKWDGAEQHFRKVLELNPQMADARKYLAETLLNARKYPEALAEYEAYLAAVPNAPEEDKQVVATLRKKVEQDQKQQQQQQKKQPKK